MILGQPSNPASVRALLGWLQPCEPCRHRVFQEFPYECIIFVSLTRRAIPAPGDDFKDLKRTAVTQSHLDPVPVKGHALLIIMFSWHFASGETKAKNS